jgi:hypothetical protein
MRAFIADERMSRGTLVRNGVSGNFTGAALHSALARAFDQVEPVTDAPSALPKAASNVQTGHYVVILELRSGSSVKVEEALKPLGKFYRLNHAVWLVQSQMPLGTVQNAIVPALGSTDVLLIVDTILNKFATYNLGPQAVASVKALWN